MLPEFEAAVTGIAAGESKTFPLTFPADYHGKEVAGKAGGVRADGEERRRGQLPAVDAEFAKAFGVASGSLDELRAEIGQNLALELKRKIEGKVKEQAFAALRSKAEFALPKSLVEIEADGHDAQDGRRPDAAGDEGRGREALAGHVPRQRRGARRARACRRRTRARHGLAAKPDQVKALVHEAAQTYEQPEAVVRWHYEKAERLAEFEALAVERNVVDWVLARARVVDKPSTFADLMGPARG